MSKMLADPTELYFTFNKLNYDPNRPLTQGVAPQFERAVVGPRKTIAQFHLALSEKGLEDVRVEFQLNRPDTEICEIFERHGFTPPKTEHRPSVMFIKTLFMLMRR